MLERRPCWKQVSWSEPMVWRASIERHLRKSLRPDCDELYPWIKLGLYPVSLQELYAWIGERSQVWREHLQGTGCSEWGLLSSRKQRHRREIAIIESVTFSFQCEFNFFNKEVAPWDIAQLQKTRLFSKSPLTLYILWLFLRSVYHAQGQVRPNSFLWGQHRAQCLFSEALS